MESWGKYRLESLIARGGMAEVFRASASGPSGFSKPVCLKRVRAEFCDDPEFVEMFEREARIAATLQHPNIVQVFDFDRHEGRLFLAMELVDGLDLRVILRAVRALGLRLPVGFALHVASGLLAALRHAHGRSVDGAPAPVVHRDVSPHNLLVSADGAVKLADFGIAKAAGTAAATRTGVVKGKLAYLSPEQVRGEEAGPASDLFGAGVVLWEMLAGERPFRGETDREILARVVSAERPRLPWLSGDIQGVVGRLLEVDPAERFPDAGAALDALADVGEPRCRDEEAGALVAALRDTAPVEPMARDGSTERIVPSGPGRAAPASLADEPTRTSSSEIPAPRGAPYDGRIGRRWALLAGAAVVASAAVLAILFGGREEAGGPPSAPDASVDAAETPRSEEPRPVHPVETSAMEGSAPDGAPPIEPDAGPGPSDAGDGGTVERRRRGWGRLDVLCRPWASVEVDGRDRGATPIKGLRLPAGSHRLTLVNEEASYRRSFVVDVEPGRTTTVSKRVPSAPGTQ